MLDDIHYATTGSYQNYGLYSGYIMYIPSGSTNGPFKFIERTTNNFIMKLYTEHISV